MDALLKLLPAWKARARARRSRGGRLHVLRRVGSRELGTERDILVYTPPSYRRGRRRYPVIYMQDGQNLFDPRTSFAGDWGVGEAVGWAAKRGHETIVVGLPNTPNRLNEYSPFVQEELGGGEGDAYLDYIVGVVKPLVDRRFRTMPGREHTGIGGSSLGGLISLYALFRRPAVFGFAAVLSPAFWFGHGAILDFVKAAPPVDGTVYLDIGLREGDGTVALARRMRDLLIDKGFVPSKNLRWVEDKSGQHNEADWGRRFRKALPFLLRNGAA